MNDTIPYETLRRSQDAVAAYCKGSGFEDVSFDDRQRIDLKINGRPVSFCFVKDPLPTLWIGCEIGSLDPDDRDALTWLLSAGMQPWLLHGERIGLLPQSTTAVTYVTIAADSVDRENLSFVVDSLRKAADEYDNKINARDFTQKPH